MPKLGRVEKRLVNGWKIECERGDRDEAPQIEDGLSAWLRHNDPKEGGGVSVLGSA
jgi:hypothetical protein